MIYYFLDLRRSPGSVEGLSFKGLLSDLLIGLLMDDRAALMITSPFPDYVGFSVVTMDTLGRYALSPEEERILSSRAVRKRRDEFLMGRAASFHAMMRAGIESPPPVPKGPSNEPIWPEGYVGAITHSSGVAVSAVCPADRLDGIGVDIENFKRNVSPNVYRLTCLKEELEQIHVDESQSRLMFMRIFSAKEAGFKAFFPLAQEYIDYKEAALSWDTDQECFHGTLLKAAGPKYPKGSYFRVGSRVVDRFVFSFVLLPSKAP